MDIKGKAEDIASKVKCHNVDSSVEDVLRTTDWLSQSCVIVCDDTNKLFGVISESDILEAEKQDRNIKALKSWELCSHNMIVVKPDTDIKEVIILMLKHHVHHVLISNHDGQCDSIISSLDILKAICGDE